MRKHIQNEKDGRMKGSKPKFTPEEFSAKVDEYLMERMERNEIPMIEHFAMYADISKEQLYKRYREHPEYEGAYGKLERGRNGMTAFFLANPDETRKGASTIFLAKNYLGMSDKQELAHTSPDGSMSPQSVDSATVSALVDKLTD